MSISSTSSGTSREGQRAPADEDRGGDTLRALGRMACRPPVNLLFEDLCFTVGTTKGPREILHSVSGEMRSGEVTAVIGPSGAGKSSLLNILSAYENDGVSGCVLVNGRAREPRVFRRLSSYILQDDLLQPRLSVLEAMHMVADLKLGSELASTEKLLIVKEILQALGIWEHRHTRTEVLSGGQSKRLSIALELINNPPIIFLDEPTTGLDVVSVRNLVVLLRFLSRQGRTIVCTIHQPSASLFALLDRVYVLARGHCCYQGVPTLLVPFLSSLHLHCPTTHNPADFVLEALCNDITNVTRMTELIENGKLSKRLPRIDGRGGCSPVQTGEPIQKMHISHITTEAELNMQFASTFFTQFCILSKRIYLQNIRNATSLWIQLIHHIITALLVGGVFFMVGNDGSRPMDNFKFFVCVMTFFMYTHVMIPVLLFPQEVRLLKREYFNRWYGLKAYYAAFTVSTIPVMLLLGSIFSTITYVMSGQLLELKRFIPFSIAALMTAICSESLGIAIGAIFNVTNGSIVGPAAVTPLLALCVYGIGYGPNIETSMKFLMSLSYLRYGIVGLTVPLYTDRDNMDCKDKYCHYGDPKLLIRDLGMTNTIFIYQILGLTFFTLVYRSIAYFALRFRLSATLSNRTQIVRYISSITKYK